jgi:uncharacterized LabA/DUF88 family protein
MDIEIAVHAMEYAGQIDEMILFSGDGDFRSIRAAGVLTGGFSSEALTEAGCFAVAKDLQHLLTRLESEPEPATRG